MSTAKTKTRIGILISGRGSNMLALADSIAAGRVRNAEIAVVISDKEMAAGIAAANERGLKVVVIQRRGRTREDHDGEIIRTLDGLAVDLICLAGYMRMLSNRFTERFDRRILNIHPSLLPSFPGLHPQQQAIDHGVKWSGCTVHFVDETLDDGPIVAQAVVPVMDDDDEDTLASRILEQEHRLYSKALDFLINEEYEVVGRRIIPTGRS
jgi:phosphoribosylglycinamide formyltransferase-1